MKTRARIASGAGLGAGLVTLGAAWAQPSARNAPPPPIQCEVQAHYRFENGTAATPAGGTGTILDSVGTAHGTPVGGPVYRADVGAGTVVSCDCEANALSLDLTPGQSVRVDAPFIFHQPHADATLEFLVKPRAQSHNSLFWTRADNGDANRYNITINTNGGFGFDYRAASGVLHLTPAHISIFQLPLGAWSHVAIVRDTQTSAPAHVYSFYVNGSLVTSRIDSVPDLPNSQVWQISGRVGFYYSGWIDEIRFTPRRLAPGAFAVGGSCPCYPDCNADGALTVADFGCFQTNFIVGAPYADCNADGSLTVADFGCFQTNFVTGCP